MQVSARLSEWVPLVGLLRRELRRHRTGRLSRLLEYAPSAGYTSVRYRRVPVTARIDAGLRLDEHRRALVERIDDGLRSRHIPHWWLPAAPGDRRTLCLRYEHRQLFIELIASLAGPSWYVDTLSGTGVAAGTLRSAARLSGRALRGAAGLLVWEFAAPDPSSTFVATEREGLRVHFWAPAGQGTLRSLVANSVIIELPDSDPADPVRLPEALSRPLISVVRFPVDAVYTWVDSTDERWLSSKVAAAGAADRRLFTERAADAVRFADHGELRYSLRALEQFAPWIRHVWVVTADQHPPWLAVDDPWVTVVPHRDLFPDPTVLPTFNSHAIEACVHRIPGLAEHFLYLNDDMFLGRPLTAERFYHPSGVGKFFHSNALVDFTPVRAEEVASSTAAKNARRLLDGKFGVTLTRKFFHTAAALTRSGMSRLEEEFPEHFEATRSARFRSVHDIAAAGSLYLNYGYLTGLLVPGRLRYTYIDPASTEAAARLDRLVRRRDFDAFCLNDGATEESQESRLRTDRLIRRFLAAYLPVPGSFEIGTELSKGLGTGK